MKHENGKHPSIDEIATRIRDESIDPAMVERAAARVHERLSTASADTESAGQDTTIRTCDDFQALIPAQLSGSLSGARELLFRDHSRSCIPCRKALVAARDGAHAPVAANTAPRRWGSAIAAALVVGLAAGSAYFMLQSRQLSGAIAEVQSTEGALFRADGQTPLAVGDTLEASEVVRTTKEAGAVVRLADGSLIEMAARSQIAVETRKAGTTIDLGRGNIIIRAAKQRTGHLFVRTDDCLVSVTGTTFAVNHGTKGSRVSVIEGTVEVDSGQGEHVLTAGQQVTTHPSISRVPVEQEIAWSRDIDSHLQMLAEFAEIGREIERAVPAPRPRLSSRLLEVVPADTVLYAAVPNLSQSLSDAYELFRARVQDSPMLNEWWDEARASGDDVRIDQSIARIRELGRHLGDEIVFTVQVGADGRPSGHLLLAEVGSADALFALLEDPALLDNSQHHDIDLHVTDDPRTLANLEIEPDITVWVRDGLLVAATEPEALLAFASEGNDRSFVDSPFHGRIDEAYRDGVSWVFAADLERILADRFDRDDLDDHQLRDRDVHERMGLLDLQHVIVDQRTVGDRSYKRATLAFDQPRRGMASWLAAPAPMAGLEFLSPDAPLASAFVVKNPATMLDDLLAAMESAEPGMSRHLAEFEREHGLRIREDLAAPLGGEVVIAIDGPVLPTPAWKLIVEVYQPGVLQRTIETLVDRVNDELRADGDEELLLSSTVIAGREYFTLDTPAPAPDVHYLFVDGYVLVASDRGLLDRAIRARESGRNLASSQSLVGLFPEDGYANFSAIVYHNLAALVGPLADRVAGADLGLSQEQQDTIARLASNTEPQLLYGYAERDRIQFATSGRAGILGIDWRTLLSLQGLLDIGEALEEAIQQGHDEETVH